MISKRLIAQCLALVLLVLANACGNYSNEDLDFQLALPDQRDIEAKLQVSINRPDSAEYYKDTRSAVATFNTLVLNLTSFVDHVRGYPPTSRNGNERTWGPFPSDKYPGWQIRVVMTRSTLSSSLFRMDYQVDLRRTTQDSATWVSLLTGSYGSQGNAHSAQGEIHFLVQAVRAVGYPVDSDPGLVDLDHMDVSYQNSVYPRSVDLQITNRPTSTTTSGLYRYTQAQDGSGTMSFDWQGLGNNGTLITATMKSRWLGTGSGRADLILEPATLALLLGTDCWGPDTVATYSHRLQGNISSGNPQSCVF